MFWLCSPGIEGASSIQRSKTRYETGSTRERQHDSAVLRATLPFEDYEIGYVRTDIAELRYESGKGPVCRCGRHLEARVRPHPRLL